MVQVSPGKRKVLRVHFYFCLSEPGSLLFVSTVALYLILLSSLCRLKGESYGLGRANG